MSYTIISRRKGTRKFILFVNTLCHSTFFGFEVNPKTTYCRAYCYLTGTNELIKRGKITEYIDYFKHMLSQTSWGRQAFEPEVKGK